ncbi:MAG: LuxR C-terminal-related transcriptional regulator [Candidatus Acidiferrales bacterium]
MANEKALDGTGKAPKPTPYDFGEAHQLLADLFNASVLGIAILDREFRYLAVNNALATINGISVHAHLGRTVREILGHAATVIETAMNRVLVTGQSVSNCEITAELPTRNEEGHWLANYYPIKDAGGRVKQIAALVIETTKQRKLEEYLLNLMGDLPRIRDQVICMGLPDRTENDRIESWAGSVEMLDNCVREARRISPLLQLPMRLHKIANLVEHQQISSPYISATRSRGDSPSYHSSARDGDHGTNRLSPREIEIVRLLAAGKGNKEISAALTLSVKTVETHRARIMLKLNFHSISEVVRFAVRAKMIEA